MADEVHTLPDVAAVDTYDLADQLSSALEPTVHGELLKEESSYVRTQELISYVASALRPNKDSPPVIHPGVTFLPDIILQHG